MKGKKAFFSELRNYILNEVRKQGISNISELLESVRHRYLEEIKKYGIKDPEQSWKPFKGKLLEELVINAIEKELKEEGLKIIKGSLLTRENLTECFSWIKRSLVVDYGEFGMHLPDVDMVIYDPSTCKALAIISSKSTLRERIAQTGYWYLKLKTSEATKKIKVFFITLDEDGDLRVRKPSKKGRAIVEVDTDGAFVITNEPIEESGKVMNFEKFKHVINKLKEG
ncbi:MAG: BsaWI family type II restriction enzyme [Aquificaceae bacterium]|nr:BsaWI family type II restriction enzyme [Aquificaceae bacterium]MDW8423985.1 BsaWI family type II restriction enzyme [Aquificaceae bacterium]